MSGTGRRRIALLSSYPHDHQSFTGGVQTATAGLVEGLTRVDHEFEVHVVTSASSSADVHECRDGVWFHFLSVPFERWLRPRFPARISKGAGALREIDPALVHCHDTIVVAPAAFGRRWVKVFSVHGIKGSEASLRTGWERASTTFEALVARGVMRRFDALVCNSRYSATATGVALPVFQVPNAVSERFFSVQPEPPDDPRLLFVGALTPLKRPADLVEAHVSLLSDHPRLTTSFVGAVEDDAYARALRARSASHPSITWEGPVSPARLAEMLASASALVLPSLQENVPMVLAEAMAAGVPVVASRVGGVPEMIEDGVNGLLFGAGDATELTRRLRELLGDPTEARRLAANGRAAARERYAPEAVARAALDVYRRLLAGGPR